MQAIGRSVDRARRSVSHLHWFLTTGVWERDYSRQRGLQFVVMRQLQVLLLVLRGMRQNAIQLRAASLALITLFSIVPALAVVFSVFKAVGGVEKVELQLQAFIYQNIAVGAQDEFVAGVQRFIGRISGGAVGGIGSLFLVYAAIRVMAAVEEAFNDIWGVRRPRPVLSRFVIYWVMLTLGPIALAASVTGTAALQGWLSEAFQFPGAGWLFSLAPAAITIGAFTLLYMVIPHTEVRFRHALMGGVVAGLVFEVAKYTYAWVAKTFFSYSAIYGSVGAIPVFIIWVNIAWILVLFGCELTFANQNVRTLRHEEKARHASERFRELLASRLVLESAVDFYTDQAPATAQDFAWRTGVPVRLVQDVLRVLTDAGVVREVALPDSQDPGHVPGRPLERLTVSDVVGAVRQRRGISLEMDEGARRDFLRDLMESGEAAAGAVWGEVDYLTLARRFAPDRQPELALADRDLGRSVPPTA